MKILSLINNNLIKLLLLLIIGLQLMVLSQLSSRVSQQDMFRLEARLADMHQELNVLASQQSYITTPNGVAINISRHDIEQAIAVAVRETLGDQPGGTALVANQTPYVEAPLTTLQEQSRFQSHQAVNQIIDNAIMMGHWTKQDTQDLLPHMGNLSMAQRNELIKKFTDAISSNHLQLDVPPPPL